MKVEGMRAAEKKCRKLPTGKVEYSPELALLGKKWGFWKEVLRYRRTKRTGKTNKRGSYEYF